jgi:hypothetical protein
MNQPDPAARQIEIGGLAVQFHEAYERLAPSFGWITQAESAVEWRDLPGRQKRLMEAVVSEVVGPLLAALATERERTRRVVEVLEGDTGDTGEALYKIALLAGANYFKDRKPSATPPSVTGTEEG